MGISRRSLVFGRGKRVLSEDDCAETMIRISNPSNAVVREKLANSPYQSPTRTSTNNVPESGADDDSREIANEQPESNDALTSTTDIKKSSVTTKRKAGTLWNSDESMAFYECVKEVSLLHTTSQSMWCLARQKLWKDRFYVEQKEVLQRQRPDTQLLLQFMENIQRQSRDFRLRMVECLSVGQGVVGRDQCIGIA